MDFTLKAYKNLLQTLKNKGYPFITFHDYLTQTRNPKLETRNPQPTTRNSQPVTRNPQPTTRNPQLILLRHDVDLLPQNSLATAKIEHELGIKGSYYFRMVPESYDIDIIRQITELGHEVGYHYETMDTASSRHRERTLQSDLNKEEIKDCFVTKSAPRNDGMKKDELIDAAYQQFCENLEEFRQIADVKTICMHGSPRSKYDNRDIWTKYSYRELGIIGEPYFDINFDDFFYLTDTGRRWDGHRVSIRDKMPQQGQWDREGLTFRSTKDIIKAANQERLPNQIMITVHPQRWSNSLFSWTTELILQNVKNIVKRIIVRKNKG